MTAFDENPNRVFSILRRRLPPLWLASSWFYALIAVGMFSAAVIFHGAGRSASPFSPSQVWTSLSVIQKCGIVLLFVVQLYLPQDLAAAGGALVVSADRRGESLSIPSMFARILKLFPLLAPVSIILGFLTIAGSVFILPGIAINTIGSVTMPALAVQPGDAWTRFGIGARAGMKRFIQVFTANLLAGVVSVLALLLLFLPRVVTGDERYWWVGHLLGWILFVAVISLAMAARSVALALLFFEVAGDLEMQKAAAAPQKPAG